ncbi:LPXTG cell wall anchor domain-containing protein [uncultured Lactobacillus sp.]|uniref:LPXTG cell wall anchor domain-containing protein n=1 Tax=uncultured Lactobacillus sp. TaxID=153152 RepID=UPI00258C3869|nr:LPXTG cell wall anchor domain-containing protein [uncultured Lactobacillus sp.]
MKRVSTKKAATATPQVKKTAVATLPQTGQKQNHSTLLGLIISAVAWLSAFSFVNKKVHVSVDYICVYNIHSLRIFIIAYLNLDFTYFVMKMNFC